MVRHRECYRTLRQRRQDRQVITRFTMSQVGLLTRTRGNFADLYCPATSFVPYMSNPLVLFMSVCVALGLQALARSLARSARARSLSKLTLCECKEERPHRRSNELKHKPSNLQ